MWFSVPFTNQTTPKRWPWKLAYRPIKNHLIVISISFLAFNFREIIRRTSGKHSPLLFSFLISRENTKRWSNAEERKMKCGGKEKRISNSTDNENYFILSRWKIGREFHRWLPFPSPPLIFISSLYLCSRSFFHLSFTQTFHFCKIMDFTSVLRKIYGCFEINKKKAFFDYLYGI